MISHDLNEMLNSYPINSNDQNELGRLQGKISQYCGQARTSKAKAC